MEDNLEQFQTVGEKIKYYRRAKSMTLKDLSEKANLSAGYLSQLERGQTSATLISMQNIASALSVSPNVFLDVPHPVHSHIVREHEQKVFSVKNDEGSYYYNLIVSLPEERLSMKPNIKVLVPESGDKRVSMYTHMDEEMGYVLEGVLTLYLDGVKNELYPGDFFHFLSTRPHCLANYSSKLVKIFYVTLPFAEDFNM